MVKCQKRGIIKSYGSPQVIHFCQEHHLDDVSSSVRHHIRRLHMMSDFPITDGFNFDDLVKVVPKRFLYCEVVIFFFVINK